MFFFCFFSAFVQFIYHSSTTLATPLHNVFNLSPAPFYSHSILLLWWVQYINTVYNTCLVMFFFPHLKYGHVISDDSSWSRGALEIQRRAKISRATVAPDGKRGGCEKIFSSSFFASSLCPKRVKPPTPHSSDTFSISVRIHSLSPSLTHPLHPPFTAVTRVPIHSTLSAAVEGPDWRRRSWTCGAWKRERQGEKKWGIG